MEKKSKLKKINTIINTKTHKTRNKNKSSDIKQFSIRKNITNNILSELNNNTTVEKIKKNNFDKSFFLNTKKKRPNKSVFKFDSSNIYNKKSLLETSILRNSHITYKKSKKKSIQSLNAKDIKKSLDNFKFNIENHYLNIENIVEKEIKKIKKNIFEIFDDNKNFNYDIILKENQNIIKNIEDNIKNSINSKDSQLAMHNMLQFFKNHDTNHLISTNYIKFKENKTKLISNILKTTLGERIKKPDYILNQICIYFNDKNNDINNDEAVKGGDNLQWIKYNSYNTNILNENKTSNKKIDLSKIISNKNIMQNNSNILSRKKQRRTTSFLIKPLFNFVKISEIKFPKINSKKSPLIHFIDNDILFMININIINIYRINEIDLNYNKTTNNENIFYNNDLKFILLQSIDINLYNYTDKKSNNCKKSISNICVWTRDIDNRKVLSIALKSKELLFYEFVPDSDNENFIYKDLIKFEYAVSIMINYKNSKFLIAGNVKGKIIFIDTIRKLVIKVFQIHKGNITSLGFASNWEFFFSSSGSFSNNHDNSLKIFKLEVVFKEIFLKLLKKFSHLQGKNRGILNAKSSNILKDYLIITNGGVENKKISIIDCFKQTKLYDIDLHFGVYNFTFLYGNDLESVMKDYLGKYNIILNKNKDISKNNSNYDDIRIIFASSINEVYAIVYTNKDNKHNSLIFSNINLSNQNGSYKSNMQLLRLKEDNKYKLWITNISGNIDYFKIS